jgi:hypothetical protein
MIKQFSKALIISLIIIFSFSCKQGKKSGFFVNTSSGGINEIIVVCNQTLWDGYVGDTLRHILQCEAPMLPQPEPLFELIYIKPEKFTSNFQKHRNIIMLKTDNQYDTATFVAKKDIWARPQIIVNITAKNESDLSKFLTINNNKIVDFFEETERNRLIAGYELNSDKVIREKLLSKHKLMITVPKGYSLDIDKDDFIWISSEGPDLIQNIYIYYYDYTSPDIFTLNNLIKKRNEILKQVPGPDPGTYLTTENLVTPSFRQFKYQNKYFAEIRGLWKIEGYFMGGPFVSLSTIDEKRNRVVTVEAVLFAPKYNKRNYLTQMEAILYTIKFE